MQFLVKFITQNIFKNQAEAVERKFFQPWPNPSNVSVDYFKFDIFCNKCSNNEFFI